MRKFLTKIIIFSIPVILVLIPPMLVLKLSGENYTEIDHLIENKTRYLIGYAYNEPNYKYLKWKEINVRPKQDIIALGSSRILQLREGMFTSSFYNAGYTITGVSDFIPFLKGIPKTKYPKVLLINLDQWMFNDNWRESSENSPDPSKWENSFTKIASLNTQLSVWSDLISRKYGYASLYENKNSNSLVKVGLNAIVNEKGFRNDGSIYYGKQISKLITKDKTANDFNYKETFSKIKKGKRNFAFGNKINKDAIIELDKFLQYCKTNNIYVVSIIPPFADKVNEYLKTSGKYTYMDKIYNSCLPVFNKYGFELWDMTFLKKYGSGDIETLDGFHGGEVSYLKMLIFIVENNSTLKDHVNLLKLKEELKNRTSDYIVYKY